jgi:PAS domain S-box-containing protein
MTKGRICEFNPAAEQTFGFARKKVLGKLLAETIIPHRYREAHAIGLSRFLATGKARVMGRRIELSALRADGSEFPCELTITLTRIAGRPLFTAYLRDIGVRVRAERRQAAQFAVTRVLAEARTLAEAAPQILRAVCESLGWDLGVIWRVTGDELVCVELWHAEDANFPEFVASTRAGSFTPGQGLPGKIWTDAKPVWLPDVTRDRNFPRAKVAGKCGLRAAFGFPVRLGSNVLGVVEFFSREIREPDAELLEIFAAIGAQIGLFIERRRAEDELRALNADLERRVAARTRELATAKEQVERALAAEQEIGMLKSSFISTVTHEFRTPLGVILSSAEMLQHYFERLEATERNEQLQTINDAVQRMAALMEEVLLFHKVEGGMSELNIEEHDFAGLCQRIANEVASATAHRCEIGCRPAARLPVARFDERLVRHILVNLLNNAVKYSEPGSPGGTPRQACGSGTPCLTIRDRGHRHPGGGFAIALRAVPSREQRRPPVRHGARALDRQALRRSSWRRTRHRKRSWQRHHRHAQAPRIRLNSHSPVHTPTLEAMKTILLIEDEPQMRRNVLRMLELEGYKAIGAEDGFAGVDAATRERPDLILCDVTMPGLDGYGVLAKLRERPAHRDDPVHLPHRERREGDVRAGMNLGADDYLVKPVAIKELLAAMQARFERTKLATRAGRQAWRSIPPHRSRSSASRDAKPKCCFGSRRARRTRRSGIILEAATATVKKHVERVLEKLGAENRQSAALRAIEVLSGG